MATTTIAQQAVLGARAAASTSGSRARVQPFTSRHVMRGAALVARPSAEAGVSAARVLAHHAAYAVSRMAFVRAQNSVIAVAGATGVALVTAVRSVVVGLASAALFCASTPSQCMTPTQSACAGLVVAGGVTYALAPPPPAAGAKDKRA